MFYLHFVNFIGNLDIQFPTHKLPSESPIFLSYREKEDLSKHEILRRFEKLLDNNSIKFLRPYKSLTSEWLVDLQELKYSFPCFRDTKYLKGTLSVEPQYFQNKKLDDYSVLDTEEN